MAADDEPADATDEARADEARADEARAGAHPPAADRRSDADQGSLTLAG
jgi:hypothetical protein